MSKSIFPFEPGTPYYVTAMEEITEQMPEAARGGKTMLKRYIVLFMNMENGKVKFDEFTDASEREAIGSFNACYRHAVYQILAVVEKPEMKAE